MPIDLTEGCIVDVLIHVLRTFERCGIVVLGA